MKRKPTKAQTRAIERIRKCGSLMVCGDQYMDHAGNVINARTVRCLIRDGVLADGADALFADCDSQTLVLTDAGNV